MASLIRTWWQSLYDGKVHAYDLEAYANKPYLESDCGQSVPRDRVKKSSTAGELCGLCLIAFGEQIPEDQPSGDAL
jgi:hypothetical protein